MFNLTYTTKGNTFSPPFYNYAGSVDALYVGDDDGNLWKITGVFNGTPTVAAGWPILVNSGHKLTGPVFDFSTNNIIVADDSGRVSFVKDTGSVTGSCASGSAPCLGSSVITGLTNITDAPILDGGTSKILVFSGSNGSNAVVVQDDTALSGGLNRVTTPIGHASITTQVHAGTFDSNYFSSSPANGSLYVCGKAAATDNPALYRIGFDGAGKLNSTTASGPLLLTTVTTGAECSPVSEIFNSNQAPGGIDWLLVGVPSSCAFGGSATGCVMSFNITSGFPTHCKRHWVRSGRHERNCRR